MVNLNEYEEYWRGMLIRVPEIKKLYFVTIESDIQSVLPNIAPEMQPFLMVVIPSAQSIGSYDNAEENNLGLIYLWKKDDRSKTTIEQIFGTQKELQPILEKIKFQMREDKRTCNIMRHLDFKTMQTDPERKLYNELSGWSMSFIFQSE
jgi:hypothetical protein